MWWRLGFIGALLGVLGVHLGFPVYPWGLYVYAGGLVLDLWTTLEALDLGGREENPLARVFLRLGIWGLPFMSLLILVLTGATWGFFQAAFVLGMVHLVAGSNNLRGLLRLSASARYGLRP